MLAYLFARNVYMPMGMLMIPPCVPAKCLASLGNAHVHIMNCAFAVAVLLRCGFLLAASGWTSYAKHQKIDVDAWVLIYVYEVSDEKGSRLGVWCFAHL